MNYKTKIELYEGDITAFPADAIVNAANNQLQLGAGVAGAIRKVGGPSIQEECDKHGPISIGDAAITYAGDLPAKYVIHAASMGLGTQTQESDLLNSVRAALRLAETHGVKTITFPAIGAGIAGFPVRRCAEVMKKAVESHLASGSNLETVKFVLYGQAAYDVFKEVFEA